MDLVLGLQKLAIGAAESEKLCSACSCLCSSCSVMGNCFPTDQRL